MGVAHGVLASVSECVGVTCLAPVCNGQTTVQQSFDEGRAVNPQRSYICM